MIPYLPPELIRQIIESSIPHCFQYRPYRERRQNLLKLCLVSQHFREIAQPLLHEIVSMSTKASILHIKNLAREGGWTERLRQTVISSYMQGGLPRTLKRLAFVFTRITVLALIDPHKGGFDMSSLSDFASEYRFLPLPRVRRPDPRKPKDLETLQLECNGLIGLEGVRLSKLLSLTLLGGSCRAPAVFNFLVPSALPLLQILALPDISKSRLLYATRDRASLELLAQLHALFLPGSALSATTIEAVGPFLPKTLVDLDDSTPGFNERVVGQVEHARIFNCRKYRFGGLETLLSDQSIPLQSIYLSKDFKWPRCAHEPATSACKTCSIEIIYETVMGDWDFEPGISEGFLRRQRERRRLEADQTIQEEKA